MTIRRLAAGALFLLIGCGRIGLDLGQVTAEIQAASSGLVVTAGVEEGDSVDYLAFDMRDDLSADELHTWWCTVALPILDARSDGREVSVRIDGREADFSRECP